MLLKRFREEYRKGRLAADDNYNMGQLRKALRKAGPNDTLLYRKVPAAHRSSLLRRGWTLVERDGTYVDGSGGSWADFSLMSYPRDKAEDALTPSGRGGKIEA